MKYILAPSILAADFKKLGEEIQATEKSGAEYLHFDVMAVLKSIKSCTNQVIDAHLMINEPIRYVEAFQKAGADLITVHLEACEDVHKTLQKIKECGMKAGISICPDTPVSALEEYVEEADMILIMSVHPGFGGQKFIEDSLTKIRMTREMLNRYGLETDIQVDGGIYTSNVENVLKAGANIIVAGSAVFKGDAKENTKEFMEILKKYE